eukprot:2922084-Karenia_brevis.AAC.1
MPKSPSVWVEDDEWPEMAKHLVADKVFGLLEKDEVACFKGKPMLHGSIGVVKRGRPQLDNGKAVLHLVMHLAATN